MNDGDVPFPDRRLPSMSVKRKVSVSVDRA
jgi:hypothetical protein